MKLQHKFVELMPAVLEEGIIYISIEYGTAIHKCVCGCGNKIVTPITPTDWKLTFDGETISLFPSIGNWGLECKSHYWIIENRVKFARTWNDTEIEKGRLKDKRKTEKYFKKKKKSGND